VYKNILVPTDGSKLAGKGAKQAVMLAASLGAKVTAVYVTAPYQPSHAEEAAKAARKALAEVEIEAHTAGVPFATRVVNAARPHEGILRAARAAKCDAIAMASHGRGALGGLLLGSETTRVLAHSRIPVIVYR
jgi:nucleotide-binding universal stress UspA family protein